MQTRVHNGDVEMKNLRNRAKAIRPTISKILSPAVIDEVTRHRAHVLSSEDPHEITDYITRATDSECLCVLSEICLNAPLNETYYRLFVCLAVKVFTLLGFEIQQDILEPCQAKLSSTEEHALESFRLDIRITQKRTTRNGAH